MLSVVVAGCALVHGINFDGWPGRENDDEGTYAAQAYAMRYLGHLAHYRYWYDHPFGGWAQIAGYASVTDAFDRARTAVTAAREFMFWVHLASCALLYLLARRLDLRRFSAAATVALFSLSPLAVWFQRMVFLDNIELMWILAALAVAASSRGRASVAAASGALLGIAFWSKESALLVIPGVLLMLWTAGAGRSRRDRLVASAFLLAVLACVAGSWVLYAVVRGDLSQLEWTTRFQLFDRTSSGSALDAGTEARRLVYFWFDIDPYLLGAGLVAALPALLIRRLQAVAVLLLIQAAVPMRDGYLPYSFVIIALPFAALCVGGVLDELCPRRETLATRPVAGRPEPEANESGLVPLTAGQAAAAAGSGAAWPAARTARARLVAVAAIAACGLVVLPWQWQPTLRTALTSDASLPSREATSWFLKNVPPGQVTFTDDIIWLDLERAGQDPIWYWRTKDFDVAGLLPGGWRDVDYVILDVWMAEPGTRRALPLLDEALAHSVLVRSFGDGSAKMSIYRVEAG